MFEEVNKLTLAKPPAISLPKDDSSCCESEEDSPLFLTKSKISLTSTVASPMLVGRKGS